jgi:SAM-dependent methyltransferase
MDRLAAHWERVYSTRSPNEVSWFEDRPQTSLEMIEGLGLPHDAAILDVGGGASRLAGELVALGYTDLTVMDVSSAALERARTGFAGPGLVEWVLADVREHDFGRQFALWHDRATFHFAVSEEDPRHLRPRRPRSLQRPARPALFGRGAGGDGRRRRPARVMAAPGPPHPRGSDPAVPLRLLRRAPP